MGAGLSVIGVEWYTSCVTWQITRLDLRRMTFDAWVMTHGVRFMKCDERCSSADHADGDCENHDNEYCCTCRDNDNHDGWCWWGFIQAVEGKRVCEALHLSLSLPNLSVRRYSQGDKLQSNYLPWLFVSAASTVLSCLTFQLNENPLKRCVLARNMSSCIAVHLQTWTMLPQHQHRFQLCFQNWNRVGMGAFFGINIWISIGTDVDRAGTIITVIVACFTKLMILTSMLFVNIAIIHHSSSIMDRYPPVAYHPTSSLCMASTWGHEHKLHARNQC